MRSNFKLHLGFNTSPSIFTSVKAFAISLPVLILMGCSGGDMTASNDVPQTNSTASTPTATAPTNTAAKTLTAYDKGARVYKKCRTCHTVEDGGRHKVGPNLWAIYDATAGTKEGFAYSKAMKESGIVWTAETMDGYMENPTKFMPGNRMSFIGLRKKEDRDNLQVYLREITTPKK